MFLIVRNNMRTVINERTQSYVYVKVLFVMFKVLTSIIFDLILTSRQLYSIAIANVFSQFV